MFPYIFVNTYSTYINYVIGNLYIDLVGTMCSITSILPKSYDACAVNKCCRTIFYLEQYLIGVGLREKWFMNPYTSLQNLIY